MNRTIHYFQDRIDIYIYIYICSHPPHKVHLLILFTFERFFKSSAGLDWSDFDRWSLEPQRLKYIEITKDKHEFSFTFEVFVQMVRELTELSSQEIIKIIRSRHSFLMSFEKVSRKRNMPCEPLSSEVIQIIWSTYAFLMSLGRGVRSRDISF